TAALMSMMGGAVIARQQRVLERETPSPEDRRVAVLALSGWLREGERPSPVAPGCTPIQRASWRCAHAMTPAWWAATLPPVSWRSVLP
ncbi:MAG: hypothetical protein R6U42_05210, partial [Halomonas sp.]